MNENEFKEKIKELHAYMEHPNSENEEDKKNDTSWAIPALALMSILFQPNNSMLEKEVAYLHGKVDTLEKIINK